MLTPILVIGNKNYSSWSLRPWIFMKQTGIDFSEKRVPLFTDTMISDLEPYFSNSKVPILVDDIIVWDSLAIMEYLSEKYLAGRGWPVDEKARAIARSVSAEMHSSFAELRNALPMNCRKKFPNYKISPAVQLDIDRVKALWKKCRTDYGQNGEWLFGDFSIADAMFVPVALRFTGYDVALNDVEESYVQTVLANKYIHEWIESGRMETEVIEIDEAQE